MLSTHNGAAVIGICGGYQMLGRTLHDPDRVESSITETEGMGLLPVSTVFRGDKETHRVKGRVASAVGMLSGASGLPVQGYEIHMGRTVGDGVAAPVRIEDRSDAPVTEEDAWDGAIDSTGMVLGVYLHGLFHNGELRRSVLNELARRKGVTLDTAEYDLDLDLEYDPVGGMGALQPGHGPGLPHGWLGPGPLRRTGQSGWQARRYRGSR